MISRIHHFRAKTHLLLCLLLIGLTVLHQSAAFLIANPLESHLTTTARRKAGRPCLHTAFAKKDSKKKQQDSPASAADVDPLMQEIKHRRLSNNPYYKLFHTDWKQQERPEHVHVILFDANTDKQGIHSIEYPKGSGSNFVLAFQSLAACQKFVAALKAQKLGRPTPKRYKLDFLEDFCDDLGVFVQVVPMGMNIAPPTQNVENFGHNPHLLEEKNHLDYLFDMFELEVNDEGLLIASEGVGSCWE